MKANKESGKKSKKRKNSEENCEDKGLEDETEPTRVSKRKRRKTIKNKAADEEEDEVEIEEAAANSGRENKTKKCKSGGQVGCGSSTSDTGGDSVIIKPRDFTAFGAFAQHTLGRF